MARHISSHILANIGKKSEMIENNIVTIDKKDEVAEVKPKTESRKQSNGNKQISIYVSKEIKDKLSQIAKEKNINMTNLIKFIENSFYNKNIEFNQNESKFDDLNKLAKNGRKVGISLILNMEQIEKRALERKFEKVNDYFEKMFEVIIDELM